MIKDVGKMTVEEKKRTIEQISDDIINDKPFIYESMTYACRFCSKSSLLTFITMIIKHAKSIGIDDDLLKDCYELAKLDEVDALKYLVDKMSNTLKNDDK